MSNCLRWLRQINLAKLLPDQFTSFSSGALIAISTLLITVIRDVEGLLLSLYLDSTRRLIIIINFNHFTSTLFSVQLDRVSGTRTKGARLKNTVTPRKPLSEHSIQLSVRYCNNWEWEAKRSSQAMMCWSDVYNALLPLLMVVLWCKVQVANENGKWYLGLQAQSARNR